MKSSTKVYKLKPSKLLNNSKTNHLSNYSANFRTNNKRLTEQGIVYRRRLSPSKKVNKISLDMKRDIIARVTVLTLHKKVFMSNFTNIRMSHR